MTAPALASLVFGFLLVLTRLSGLLLLVPGLGDGAVPMPIRAALAVALAVLLLPVVQTLLPALPASPWLVARCLAVQLAIGLWLGFLASLVAQALIIAAQLLSYMIGLSNVLVPDRSGTDQTSVIAQLFGLAPPLLLLASGLYAVPLAALVASFSRLPAATSFAAPDAVGLVVHATSAGFGLAIRLAVPFLLAHTVWQVLIGAAGRLAPALHLPILALPGQLLGGLLLLAEAVPLLMHLWLVALPPFLSPAGL